jgi:two-component system chemotaxis sensor kinase CheA
MQNMLRPIVEAAGYRVVGDAHGGEADVVIVADGTKVDKAAAKRTIRLRADPEAPHADDPSIYRYDRAALLLALKTAGGRSR